jgi:quercetin dioxygenase-like cupin family protein
MNARTCVLLSVACVGPEAAVVKPKAVDGISRQLLESHPLPEMPGWETRLYLIEYAAGVQAPVHHHPVAGTGYVVSGAFESAFEGEKPVVVREGQSFTDAVEKSHVLFRNFHDDRPLKFVISYVVRQGEPVVVTP